jgi:hypothetical protein
MAEDTNKKERVETIILRFRDLVTGLGGTVQRHNAISETKGNVWWGWWNKLGEQVPVVTFGTLLERIREEGQLRILLMDSGQNKVFEAQCTDIRWDNAKAVITSPAPDLTPDYYRTEKYLAWFELKQINEIDDRDLLCFSYVRIDEFFTENRSNYDEFYGKQICSPAELQQQNRTVWFARAYRDTDRTQYVHLLDANRITPSDFPARVLVSERKRLLWLSDLHFSVDGNHNFPLKTNDTKRDLWNALEEVLKEEPPLAGALISGDLTWKNAPQEFEQFRQFVSNLLSTTRLDNNFFMTICPGNHDLMYLKEYAKSGDDPHRVIEQARRCYEEAYKAIFYLLPNEYLCSGRRYVFGDGIPVEIVALNSSLLQQEEKTFQGHGFVGGLQLRYAAEKMGWDAGGPSANAAFRILLVHHHLLPVTYREKPTVDAHSSIVFDANAIIEWVARYHIDLVLHGHQHQPFCAKLTYPLRDQGRPEGKIISWHEFLVAGLGSTGVIVEHMGETKDNMYGVLDFDPTAVELSVRSISPQRDFTSGELWSVRIPIRRWSPCTHASASS